MTNNTRFTELEKFLEMECGKYENNCSTCPHKQECEEYARLYKENLSK